MYMAKRVFKNKKLVRSILILAGFFIVGFFLWTVLFKRGSIFEGQTGNIDVDVDPYPPTGYQSPSSINDWVKIIIALPIDGEDEKKETDRGRNIRNLTSNMNYDQVKELTTLLQKNQPTLDLSPCTNATDKRCILSIYLRSATEAVELSTATPTTTPTATPTETLTATPTTTPTATPIVQNNVTTRRV